MNAGTPSVPDVGAARAAFIEALRSAQAVRRGATPEVQATARAYAGALRSTGVGIGSALIEVKDLVRAHSGQDEPVVTPKVVGWAVAGFFAAAAP